MARHLTAIACATALLAGGASAQRSSLNIDLQARMPMPPCTLTDVSAIDGYAFLARRHLGFSVVDFRQPSAPVERLITPVGYPGTPGSLGVGDIKTDGRYVYVTSEDVVGGVYIYDIQQDPMNPVYTGFVLDRRLMHGVHNCWVDGDFIYCASNFSRRVEVFDISDRTTPVWVSSLGDDVSPVLAHDVVVRDDRAYCSFTFSGMGIYDVTNPRRPIPLGSKNYANSATHNLWPTEDGRYLYSTDENVINNVGGDIRIWDIQSLPTITQVGRFRVGPSTSLVHNVYVHGELLFVSYFTEGVRVFSIRDPLSPVEIAHYDTYPDGSPSCLSSQSYAGCWGVAISPSGQLLASDIDTGFHVLQLDLVPTTVTIQPQESMIGSASIQFEYRNNTRVPLDAFSLLAVTAINGQRVVLPLQLEFGVLPSETPMRRVFPLGPFGLPQPLNFEVAALTGPTGAGPTGPIRVEYVDIR